jgi:O6-methylguanine-DNA--protein-cysteine methyltransferase
VEGDEEVVTRIYLPHEKSKVTKGPAPRAVAIAHEQLREYFDGERTSFSVSLSTVKATSFQHDVWAALSTIPFGEVRTYADIADARGGQRQSRESLAGHRALSSRGRQDWSGRLRRRR